ncbi:hypothetical protein CDL12_22074 [Handroanthus impetiginosus]|uniref:Uncharacterized protein n=1 Tax=Handroanthus impetiginosus TaxID=429701 RepID=A0A2G9GJC4_9LAMI|nr:hypothetical protein CDL12_22074 [Handroanthus impetiginosus]
MVYQCSNLVAAQSPPVILPSRYPRLPRGLTGKETSNCCLDCSISIKFGVKQAISGLAASIVLLSQANLSTAANLSNGTICELASATEYKLSLSLDNDERNT